MAGNIEEKHVTITKPTKDKLVCIKNHEVRSERAVVTKMIEDSYEKLPKKAKTAGESK